MPDRDPRSGNLIEACLCAGTINKYPRFLEGDRPSPLCSSNNSLLGSTAKRAGLSTRRNRRRTLFPASRVELTPGSCCYPPGCCGGRSVPKRQRRIPGCSRPRTTQKHKTHTPRPKEVGGDRDSALSPPCFSEARRSSSSGECPGVMEAAAGVADPRPTWTPPSFTRSLASRRRRRKTTSRRLTGN